MKQVGRVATKEEVGGGGDGGDGDGGDGMEWSWTGQDSAGCGWVSLD